MARGKKAPRRDPEALIAHRRHCVARLKLQGYAIAAITTILHAEGLTNPATQQPWSQATIGRDVGYLQAQWQQEAHRDFASMKSEHLAAVREVRRVAWRQEELPTVLKALDQESSLLGLYNNPLADAIKEAGAGLSGLLAYAQHARNGHDVSAGS